MRRALVLFSGGLDSALALVLTLRRGYRPTLLEFQIGGRPGGERRAADRIARHYRVSERIRVPWPDHVRPRRDGYVPTRNLVMHAVAHAVAERHGIPVIVAGHLRSDDFPDAGRAFLMGLNRLANRGRPVGGRTRLWLPLYDLDAVRRRRALARFQVPVALTWSCWRGGDRPCGRCQKCRDRARLILADASGRPPRAAHRPRPG